MQNIPRPQQIYKHFKGNLYQIVTLAEHSETGEVLVIYQALYGEFKVYAHPLKMFQDKVDSVKYPFVTQEYRFELVEPKAEKMVKTEDEKTVKIESEKTVATEGKKEAQAEFGSRAEVQKAGKNEALERTEAENEEEMPNIDPMVLEFLDASTYEERLTILAGLHHRITDDMINVMAVATDIEVKPGDIEERYAELRNCLLTLEKFECNRLR